MDRYLARWTLLAVKAKAWGPDGASLGKSSSETAALARPGRHMLHEALTGLTGRAPSGCFEDVSWHLGFTCRRWNSMPLPQHVLLVN